MWQEAVLGMMLWAAAPGLGLARIGTWLSMIQILRATRDQRAGGAAASAAVNRYVNLGTDVGASGVRRAGGCLATLEP